MLYAVIHSWLSCCAWMHPVLDSTCAFGRSTGRELQLHKAFQFHRGYYSPGLGIWWDELSLGILQQVFEPSFGKHCQLLTLGAFLPAYHVKQHTWVFRLNSLFCAELFPWHKKEKSCPEHLPECSACYPWLSGKVAGEILWNKALFHGWLVESWHGPQQKCINRKAVNQLRNKPYGLQLSCALPTGDNRSTCHLRCPVTTISELLIRFLESKK